MKKLIIIAIIAALGYGAYKYMEKVQKTTAEKRETLNPGEKALKESMKE